MAQTKTTNRISDSETATDEPSQPFVGKWNELVSTTNWEKGQIISEWREALIADDAAASEFSDEAWAQLVGGVTSQHVGRLRRVYTQFGEKVEQYPGLFWSHFQAAIDWDDAEMWLEGAIQNGWSISQMRGKRWETVGKPGEQQPEEPAPELEGSLEDGQQLRDEQSGEAGEAITPQSKELQAPSEGAEKSDAKRQDTADEDAGDKQAADDQESDELEAAPTATKTKRERLPVDVDDLPDDLAEAFEQFKLAIISQRREGWSETRCETVIECLDALKMLAEAPLD